MQIILCHSCSTGQINARCQIITRNVPWYLMAKYRNGVFLSNIVSISVGWGPSPLQYQVRLNVALISIWASTCQLLVKEALILVSYKTSLNRRNKNCVCILRPHPPSASCTIQSKGGAWVIYIFHLTGAALTSPPPPLCHPPATLFATWSFQPTNNSPPPLSLMLCICNVLFSLPPHLVGTNLLQQWFLPSFTFSTTVFYFDNVYLLLNQIFYSLPAWALHWCLFFHCSAFICFHSAIFFIRIDFSAPDTLHGLYLLIKSHILQHKHIFHQQLKTISFHICF